MAKTPSLSDETALRDENVLRRVSRLGSGHNGLGEWRLQRLTALALIPLGLYFMGSILSLAVSGRATAAQWLSAPIPALLTMLFVVALFVHALVGLRSVVLDYVHTRAYLVAAELLLRAVVILLAGASILAILRIFLTGATASTSFNIFLAP